MLMLVSLSLLVSSSVVLRDVYRRRLNPPFAVVAALLLVLTGALIVITGWAALYAVRALIG